MTSQTVKPPVTTDKCRLWLCFVPLNSLIVLAFFFYRWTKLGLPSRGKTFALMVAAQLIWEFPLVALMGVLLGQIHAVWFHSGWVVLLFLYMVNTVLALIWREIEYCRLCKEIQHYIT